MNQSLPSEQRAELGELHANAAREAQEVAFQAVCALLGEKFDVEVGHVALESSLVLDLGIEQADVEYLALALEEAFEVNISAEDVPRLVTVGDAVACVLRSQAS